MRSPGRLAAVLILCGILAAALVAALNLPIAGTGSTAGSTDLIIGSPLLNKQAPDFTLTDLDGRPVSLSDYRGRPVIVNFWASWCIPCRDEFPQFVAARAQYAAAGLEILGIVRLDSADAAATFAQQHDADWPLLLDPDAAAWNAYHGLGVPSTYFIDAAGVVRATSLGPITAASLPLQLAAIIPGSAATSVP